MINAKTNTKNRNRTKTTTGSCYTSTMKKYLNNLVKEKPLLRKLIDRVPYFVDIETYLAGYEINLRYPDETRNH